MNDCGQICRARDTSLKKLPQTLHFPDIAVHIERLREKQLIELSLRSLRRPAAEMGA
jgi:hypothetical protein